MAVFAVATGDQVALLTGHTLAVTAILINPRNKLQVRRLLLRPHSYPGFVCGPRHDPTATQPHGQAQRRSPSCLPH